MTCEEIAQLQKACEETLIITNIIITSKNKQKLKEVTFEELISMLDFIRLGVKYQMLDIEATQRERKYLEKLLKENGQ